MSCPFCRNGCQVSNQEQIHPVLISVIKIFSKDVPKFWSILSFSTYLKNTCRLSENSVIRQDKEKNKNPVI